STPITRSTPSTSASTITTQVRFVIAVGARPNCSARSTTGTTLPRRLITPRTAAGALGTRVIVSYSRISFTLRMPKANSSPASWKERYCIVMDVSFLEAGEPTVVMRQRRQRRGGGALVSVAFRLRRLDRSLRRDVGHAGDAE